MNDAELFHIAKALERTKGGDVVLLKRVVRDSEPMLTNCKNMNDDYKTYGWNNPMKHRNGFRQPRTSKHKNQDRQRRRCL